MFSMWELVFAHANQFNTELFLFVVGILLVVSFLMKIKHANLFTFNKLYYSDQRREKEI